MNQLTRRQKEVLELLRTHIARHGASPTIEEMAKKLNVSSLRTVTQYLESLEKKGYISRTKNKKRSIEIIRGSDSNFKETIIMPVVGAASCGGLNVYADESFNEFIQVSKSFLKNKREGEAMAIRAMGYSMQDAGIDDGDLVLIEFTDDIKNGDVVAAVIDGMAVIKKITFTENAVVLEPVTSIGYYKQIVMRRDFRVLGKLLHVIKAVKHEDIEIVPVS